MSRRTDISNGNGQHTAHEKRMVIRWARAMRREIPSRHRAAQMELNRQIAALRRYPPCPG